ncbi:MAG: hypothetical protein ABSH51_09520 [Solirubrobacteraceae bacterium]|jgi:uncharacterized membrane protein
MTPAGDTALLQRPLPAASAHRDARGPARPWLGRSELLGVGLIAAIAILPTIARCWLVEGVELLLLLWVPGTLALRATGFSAAALCGFPVYRPAASLAVLTLTATATNLVGPALGVDQPLARGPLVLAVSVVLLALLAWGAAHDRDALGAYLPRPRIWSLGVFALPALPVLAAAGALLLTNGRSGDVAVVATALAGACLLAGCYAADRVTLGECSAAMFCIALALVWSFSLRGRFVYGSDILAEYHVFTQVLAAHRWLIHPTNGAYDSMMSLTTLPTLLAVLTGMSPLFILKAVYPALLALFPVALFGIAARHMPRRYAWLSVLVILAQNYLFAQMPGIARQEIALVFFIVLVAILTDDRVTSRSRNGWTAMFGVSMVLSHYGTTYFAILMLLGAIALTAAMSRFGGMRHAVRSLMLCTVVVSTAAFIWYVPVTHSTQNLTEVVKALRTEGLDVLPGASGHGIVGAYVSGNEPVAVSARRLESAAVRQYRTKARYVVALQVAREARFALHGAPAPGGTVRFARGLSLASLLATCVSQLLNLLAIIGGCQLMLRRRVPPALKQIGILAVATLGALAIIRVSGTFASSYNQERAFVQAMVPLSIGVGWLVWRVSRGGRLARAAAGLLPLGMIVVFFVNSGLGAVAFGGSAPASLANGTESAVRFVVDDPEISAARWVTQHAGNDLLYADRYAQLRITAATGRVGNILTEVMPETLDKDAWIFADESNVVHRTVRAQVGNEFGLYYWPGFINEYWNEVYSNGFSAGYARP